MSNKVLYKQIIITLIVIIIGMFAMTLIIIGEAGKLMDPNKCQTVRETLIYQDEGEPVKTFDYLDCKE